MDNLNDRDFYEQARVAEEEANANLLNSLAFLNMVQIKYGNTNETFKQEVIDTMHNCGMVGAEVIFSREPSFGQEDSRIYTKRLLEENLGVLDNSVEKPKPVSKVMESALRNPLIIKGISFMRDKIWLFR